MEVRKVEGIKEDDAYYWIMETKEDLRFMEEIKQEIAYNLWEQRDAIITEEDLA